MAYMYERDQISDSVKNFDYSAVSILYILWPITGMKMNICNLLFKIIVLNQSGLQDFLELCPWWKGWLKT